jgi:hypothetical protein
MSEGTGSAVAAQTAGYRLSPQQRRAWALAGDAPRSPCRVFALARIEGALDPTRLEAALAEVVARNEALRTVFPRLSGLTLPVQTVREPGPIALDRHDLTGLDPEGQAPRLAALRRALQDAPLPPAEGPLLRFQLVALGPRAHTLDVVASALCADARTLENLLDEVARGYARRAGVAPPDEAPHEVVHYADVAEVLNDILDQSPETGAGRRHWRALRLPEHEVRLPAETAPTSAVEPRVGEARVELPIAALEGLASRFDVSPAAVLLAAWQIVLWRLVGRRRFALGVAQEGRRPEDRDAAHALGA